MEFVAGITILVAIAASSFAIFILTRLRVAQADLAAKHQAWIDADQSRQAIELRLATADERAKQAEKLENRLTDLTAETERLRDQNTQLEKRITQAEEAHRNSADMAKDLKDRLASAEDDRDNLQKVLDNERELRASVAADAAKIQATLNETAKALEGKDQELAEIRAAEATLRNEAADLKSELAALAETLKQERSQHQEKVELLMTAKEELSAKFTSLSEEILTKQSETFAKQNKDQLEGLLQPVRQNIKEFEERLTVTQTEAAKERAVLTDQIKSLTETSAKMSLETTNLTRALKGESKTQGAWGEMLLESVLEKSGLRKDEEYFREYSYTGEDGTRKRPDAIVCLPGGRQIIIDSKVSLTAFESYTSAENEAEQAVHLTAHVDSIRSHIRLLGDKEYQSVIPKGVDYVIMFIPLEAALAAALRFEPAITNLALEKNIIIATPTTLLLALRTAAAVWKVERSNKNAEEIADRAGKLYDKFVGFANDLKTVGDLISNTQEAYGEAVKKLTTGRGNVIQQIEWVKALGAKTQKSLPAELLVAADAEDVRALESGVSIATG